MSELKAALGKLLSVNPAHLVVTDVWAGKICRFFADDESISEIRRGDSIFVYEIPAAAQPGQRLVPVIHFQKRADYQYR